MLPFIINEEKFTPYSYWRAAFFSSVVFADDTVLLEQIAELSNELNMFSIEFVAIGDHLQGYIDYMLPSILYEMALAVIILMFAGVGMAAALLGMVKKNMRDYSIHILCGGRVLDICTRLGLQLSITVALSLIPSLLIFKPGILTVYILSLAVGVCVIILIPSLIKLKNTSVALMVRRSE